MLNSFLREIQNRVAASKRRRALKDLANSGLSPEVLPICEYLASGFYPDARAKRIADLAEQQRQLIAASNAEPIEILYSPKPGSAEHPNRPKPGVPLLFSPERISQTGKDRRWGGFLYLCACASKARTVVELGTCAGLSAFYMASSTFVEKLITIEGSAGLARIAKDTLKDLSYKTEVINALFDDALDSLLVNGFSIDLAYIDGHHEKVATLHYFQRIKEHLNPGAWVIFDDISWSTDMRDCWNEIISKTGFSHCLDFGAVGVCIWDGRSGVGQSIDLRAVSGATGIGNPHGWKYEAKAVVE